MSSDAIHLNFTQTNAPGMLGEESIAQFTLDTVKDALPILANSSVKVGATKEAEKTDDKTGNSFLDLVPELDLPDEALAAVADLDAFLAYMEMEATDEQIQAAKKRIENLKGELEKCHSEAMDKIEKAIDELKKSERASLANRILGWLGVAFAFVSAIMTTVMTAGAAGPLAFASAGLALTSMILNETGAAEKICKAMAESIMSHGDLSKDKAEMAANLIFSSLFMVATLATGIAGGVAAASANARDFVSISLETVQKLTIASSVVNATMQAMGMTTSAVGASLSFASALAQADVTEHRMSSVELQTLMDQVEEDYQTLLNLFKEAVNALATILEERQENEEDIALYIAG